MYLYMTFPSNTVALLVLALFPLWLLPASGAADPIHTHASVVRSGWSGFSLLHVCQFIVKNSPVNSSCSCQT